MKPRLNLSQRAGNDRHRASARPARPNIEYIEKEIERLSTLERYDEALGGKLEIYVAASSSTGETMVWQLSDGSVATRSRSPFGTLSAP